MQPLTSRPESPTSIHSWWSDSNPGLQGPTINLHTMAKPLLKLMYHRQALDFLEKNRAQPLLGTTLEIYSSYFPWNYVWRPTKVAILWDLMDRATSKDEARTMVDSPVFNYIAEMLGSPDPENLGFLCRSLFERLVSYKSAVPAIWESQACVHLVRLILDENNDVLLWTMRTLTEVADCLEGAQAIVDAGVQNHLSVLLESPYPGVRKWTCQLVAKLAKHDSTTRAILGSEEPELKLCNRLLSLMR
ncbi:hypothetical protein DFH08DRAFT_506149 [Mycena albidolilacea]|uniref:Uncharacterized protein n=1 Tax=Mycena albidolilacea TaxID=1033008 RepID=A0AAD7EYA8_9AGAR|nr:hypothetical protein DFH08DRAFT_506149 [Mycena albidolilacea]